jgi:hypothetical protein
MVMERISGIRVDDIQGLKRAGVDLKQLAEKGVALFFTRTHARLFRPGLALVIPDAARDDGRLRRAFQQLEGAMDHWCSEAKLAA